MHPAPMVFTGRVGSKWNAGAQADWSEGVIRRYVWRDGGLQLRLQLTLRERSIRVTREVWGEFACPRPEVAIGWQLLYRALAMVSLDSKS